MPLPLLLDHFFLDDSALDSFAQDQPLFVAETNDSGDIAWVWVQDEAARPARPVKRIGRHLSSATRRGSRFAGATPEAIIAWMRNAEDASHAR